MTIQASLKTKCNHKLKEVLRFKQKPNGEVPFKVTEGKYERIYLQCQNCGHWFSSHSLDLTDLYKEDYVSSTYGGIEGMKKRFDKIMSLKNKESDNFQRVERIINFFNDFEGIVSKGNLLDVGCGLGVFPFAMKRKGWSVYGLEQDDRTLKYLNEEIGLENIVKDFADLRSNKFDLITLNKVLEHVVDPIELLCDVSKMMNEKGILYLEVPDTENASTLANPLSREEFFVEHHHGFTLASLSQSLDVSGLRINYVSRIIEPSGKYTIYCFCSLAKSFYLNLN